MNRVLIGCPLHNGCCDAFRRGYGDYMRHGVPGWETRWLEVGGCGITVARNVLAARAIKEGCDVLLFVASDLGFPNDKCSDAIGRVLSHFERDPGIAIVGGLYLFKKFPFQLVLDQDRDREVDDHGLIEVRATGTDFMAISVKAMRAVIDQWEDISMRIYDRQVPLSYDGNMANGPEATGVEWNIFGQAVVYEEETGVPTFAPEDFYWCRLAREAGLKIHVDSQIRLQHWGSWNYDAATATGIDKAIATAMPRAKPSAAFA